MKKTFLLFIMIFNLGFSQRNFGDTSEPLPSVSSFSSYVNTPVSLSTGVPNISLPLFTLSTGSSNVTIATVLSYHPYNAIGNKPGSEVGLGWSLSKGGVISRVVNGDVDEKFSNPAKSDYKKNVFDDVYYYDIPGESGKFRLMRDTLNNTFSLNNISGNNVKIEYTRESNNATLILNSFTITDDTGVKYIFEDYAVARNDIGAAALIYKSAFFLTRIVDKNNLVAASFNYRKDTKYSGNIIMYQTCKLQSISTQYGKIALGYLYEEYRETAGKDDPYQLETVSLSDASSRLLSTYRLKYSSFSTNNPIQVQSSNKDKRILTDLVKLDKNGQLIETRQFEYDQLGSETNYSPSGNPDEYGNFLCPDINQKNPRMFTLGLLKKMTLPEGGYVIYNFEAGETYLDSSVLQFNNDKITHPDIQFLSLAKTVDFDTHISRDYTFQVTQAKKFFVTQLTEDVYTIPDIHGDIVVSPTHKLLNALATEMQGFSDCEGTKYYNLVPGTYTFKIAGNGNGSIKAYSIANIAPPYKNRELSEIPRIAGISYYVPHGILKKSVTYQYDSFDQPNNSSGQMFSNEVCSDEDYIGGSILYQNVKEIYKGEAGTMGYTKYYFKIPDEYQVNANILYKPYYNMVSSGVLKKKEVFNPQHQILSDENTEYIFEEVPGTPEYTLCGGYRSKTAWMKSSVIVSKTFFDNGSSLQSSTETYCSAVNFQPVLVRETAPDGKITEKKISYATDLGNTRLTGARMISVPLRTEVTVNGLPVSKVETRYDSPANLYPSSVIGYNMQNQVQLTAATFDIYDNQGNPVQVMDKTGVPVVTLWGYHQTQAIAKITGLPYSQIKDLQTVTAAIAASDADADDPAQEASLLQALENLRRDPVLRNNSVMTSTYDPLIGITNSVTANGIRTIYQYDSAGRLIKVADGNGKTLKEYQYNYKH
jgi:YD repeat-containing protein